jgi:hypothetical protein
MAASLGVNQLEQQCSCGIFPDSNDVSTEAEESPLLRSVTGKRLAKADCEGLACAVVIYKVWRLAIVLYVLVGTICKW